MHVVIRSGALIFSVRLCVSDGEDARPSKGRSIGPCSRPIVTWLTPYDRAKSSAFRPQQAAEGFLSLVRATAAKPSMPFSLANCRCQKPAGMPSGAKKISAVGILAFECGPQTWLKTGVCALRLGI
jgi:hypothetical protein